MLNFIIRPKDIPPKSPVEFNTTNFNMKNLVPNLYAHFPDDLFNVHMSVSSIPVMDLSSSKGASVFIESSFTVNPIVNGQEQFAFQGLSFLTLGVILNLTGQNITADVKSVVDLSVIIQTSSIGPVDAGNMTKLITLALYAVVIPKLNSLVGTGIPLPQAGGVVLKNPVLTIRDGFLQVDTDFTFNSKQMQKVVSAIDLNSPRLLEQARKVKRKQILHFSNSQFFSTQENQRGKQLAKGIGSF